MTRQRPHTATNSTTAVDEQRFTDVEQVLARLSTLNRDFQHIEDLSAALDTCLQQYRGELSVQLSQALEKAEARATMLDARIASATATEEQVKGTGATVLANHERRWQETHQQIQQLSEQLSARVDEILTANQLWRQQLEAANASWQADEEQQAAQWRIEVSHDVSDGIETMTKKAQERAEAIDRLARSQVESDQQIRDEIAADRRIWQDNIHKQDVETARLNHSVTVLRTLLFGTWGAIIVLVLMCLFALIR